MSKNALVTGGAGFIGSNLTIRLLRDGWRVMVLDNLSRRGTDKNLAFLKSLCDAGNLDVRIQDIRDFSAVTQVVNKAEVVFHLAGQVAVTTSCLNPREDFELNALGALNVLEAARLSGHKPIILYASTNKVYGALPQVKVIKKGKRHVFADLENGINESHNLDFHSPYGCSKGAADQYMRDYYRIFGIPTVVLRQSCIYGPMQMGIEDQGWVAHFAIKALKGKQLTIYGDGRQVRDILYVDDLINAYMNAVKNITKSAGNIYNIGGGKENSLSLLEYIEHLEQILGKKIDIVFNKTRHGDQKIYISDNSKIIKDLKWQMRVSYKQGIENLLIWIKENIGLFEYIST